MTAEVSGSPYPLRVTSDGMMKQVSPSPYTGNVKEIVQIIIWRRIHVSFHSGILTLSLENYTCLEASSADTLALAG